MESIISNNIDLSEMLRLSILFLAFLVAFYALIAREKKSPLLIDSMFYAAYGLLILLSVAILSNLKGTFSTSDILLLVLFLIILFITYHILKVHNKVKYLRSDHEFRNLRIYRSLKDWKRRIKPSRTYEHYSSNIGADISKNITSSSFVFLDKIGKEDITLKLPITGIYHLCSHRKSDEVLVDLASRFIEKDKWVQYTSCTRHPVEFLTALKSHLEINHDGEYEIKSKKVVVVDAFTPHFGFTDSINSVRSDDAKKMCLKLITATPSFAGIHTSTAKAFNEIKNHSGETREPTLVIYEGLHSLVDLESDEQYRIFFSHVLPSERLWGGMFTVVVEFSPSSENLHHIRTYGDYFYADVDNHTLGSNKRSNSTSDACESNKQNEQI